MFLDDGCAVSFVRGAMLLAFAALAGCGQSAPGPNGDDTSSSSTSTTSSGSSGGPAAPPAPLVSVVAETAPGSGPAVIHFFNDTPAILTYNLGPAFFALVEPFTTTEPALAASADVPADSVLMYHSEANICVPIKTDTIPGPNILEPGLGYTVHVTKGEGKLEFYVEMLDAEKPEPFLAVRPHVPASNSDLEAPGLTLTFADPSAAPLVFDIFGSNPGGYTQLDGGAVEISRLDYSDQKGNHFAFEGSIQLSNEEARGFTFVVGSQPVEGAAAVLQLEAAE